ncbi:MAG TPA: NUDIX hydrolase [Acidimicrobiales bacterium]|jgi:8-oxo-dGTP diphosphatase|nr:NUDIX hydrolase [Acidimicrobiales bacterium]
MSAEVRAAGGVVVRDGAAGYEVLLVHRPRYDDWTLPKGKCERDERDEDAARREVEEETGYRCELGDEVAHVEYTDGRGRAKSVRYWLMRVVDGSFWPNHEVDAIVWLGAAAAHDLLTYPTDRRVLRAGLAAAGHGELHSRGTSG